jgi:hypothetical protein
VVKHLLIKCGDLNLISIIEKKKEEEGKHSDIQKPEGRWS